MGKPTPSRAKSGKKPSPSIDTPLLWRRIAWFGGAALWLFLLAAMASYNVSDPPAAGVFPFNDPVANWCGKFGAITAHYFFEMFGLAAWPLLALAGVALWFAAVSRPLGHLVVRAIGALLMAAGLAGIQAILLPSTGPVPALPGGLIGNFVSSQLVERFNAPGSIVWLLLAFTVGAVVALDVWAILVAMWAGRALRGAVMTAGRQGGRLATQLAAMRARERAAAKVRANDVDDDLPTSSKTRKKKPAPVQLDAGEAAALDQAAIATEEEPPTKARTGKRKAPAPVPGPEDQDDDADAAVPTVVADTEGEDADMPAVPTSVAPSVNAAPGEEDDAPGAPQVFDAETLRAKIARLPVRFANRDRTSATDEDLRDIQNTGGADLEGYRFPGLDLLEEPEGNYSETMESYVREQAESLERALKEYRIDGEVVGVESGPVITLYEIRLAPGTKVAVLNAVSSDLARSLKAVNIRIVPNTAGRDTVCIEVPNAHKEKVRLKELMSKFEANGKMRLPMFLGKDASGAPLIEDLCAMPHLLIAGTTGSGKSVCMNTVIMSFLYTKKPNELKLVLVDPKMVELSQFKDIPHLMCPVVTEMAKAAAILEWAVGKMDERYELLAEAGCRDIVTYNELGWDELKERLNPQSPEEEAKIPRKLPYMVFVIDELADLMMTNKEVESSIVRIAQKARAVGIHLILATQRPQANVVTGLIKSNMPGRIAFKVASGMDSRIVLDQKGGELLLGQGDMLYLSPRSHKLTRSQGTLVDDKEIRRVVKFMKEVASPTFERQLMQIRSSTAEGTEEDHKDGFINAQEDPLFDQAVEVVLETQRGSVSMLQRRLAIGYTRAARLIEMMGEAGILGGHKGTVSRDVVMSLDEWQAMKEQWLADAEAAKAAGGNASEPGSTIPRTPSGAPPLATQDDLFTDGPTLRQLNSTEPKPIKAEPDAFDDAFAEEDGWEQPESEDKGKAGGKGERAPF
jgi:S-DNA-T family DNA segregation ATPase FtsK/SpoIIIE